MINNISSYLPVSEASCLISMRWMYKQPFITRQEFKRREQKMYFELKNKHKDLSIEIVSEIAALTAAHELKILITKVQTDSWAELALVDELNIVNKEREKPKETWLKNHKSIVILMHQKGLSYRAIKEYIERKYRFKVSHQKIGEFISKNEWEKDNV